MHRSFLFQGDTHLYKFLLHRWVIVRAIPRQFPQTATIRNNRILSLSANPSRRSHPAFQAMPIPAVAINITTCTHISHLYIYNSSSEPVRKAVYPKTYRHSTDTKGISIQHSQKSRRGQFQINNDSHRHQTHNHLFCFFAARVVSISFLTSILSPSILADVWMIFDISPPVRFAV